LGKEAPVVNKWEAEWAPELVWTFWRRAKYFLCAGIQTPDHPAQNLATIQTTLPQPPWGFGKQSC